VLGSVFTTVSIFWIFLSDTYIFGIRSKNRKFETTNVATVMKLMEVFLVFGVAIKMIVMMFKLDKGRKQKNHQQ
jgi:hypothetical protein